MRIMHATLQNGMWCGLGFHLPTGDLTAYPAVRTTLEVAPKRPERPSIISLMREISAQPGWQAYHLESPYEWAGIFRARSLQDFLSSSDHVHAIKEEFRGQLVGLARVREHLGALWAEDPRGDTAAE